MPSDEVEQTLAFVAIGPQKTIEWLRAASGMSERCRGGEDVDQAAARILATEVMRLTRCIRK